jgi:hypothetical protein
MAPRRGGPGGYWVGEEEETRAADWGRVVAWEPLVLVGE